MSHSANYRFRGGDSVGSVIGTEHFGTNYLFHHDRVDEGATFAQVIDRVGVDLIRYPGGTITEEYFDLANPTATTQPSTFGRADKTVTPIQEFLGFVEQSGAEAVIVLPTYRYFDEATRQIDPAAETIIKDFVRAVLAGDYGEAAIRGFEIGNEWYQDRFDWSASEFGAFQSQMAVWIDEVLQEDAAWSAVDVYIQSGRGDDDGNGIADDQELAAEFTEAELDAVDGLISHFYAATSSGNPLILGGNVLKRLKTIDTYWGTSGADGLDLVVTEWNIGGDGPDNTSVRGLMRNVALLNVFSNMLEQGVDLSAIWTAQAPGPAGLSNSEGDDHLTATGYLYRMMRRELVDTRAVDTVQNDAVFDSDGIRIGRTYVFQGEDKTVIYLASGVGEKISLNVNFETYMKPGSHVHATVLGAAPGYDAADYRVEARMTALNDRALGDGGNHMFRLNPYEVVQVVITTGTGVDLFGDDQNATDDILDGSAHADALQGYDGDDWLRGFDGNDVIDGGAGDDLINAGNGDDVITTGAGSDTALGGAGDDTLDYSASETAVRIYARDGIAELDGAGSTDTFSGIENFIGSEHADTIFTDSATASVDSGAGDDFIRLLGGDQTAIEAGLGDDFVLAEFGSATVDLGAGSDRLLAFAARVDVDGGDGDDILHGGTENDTLDGGQGNDTLSGGGGADTFVFRNGGGSDVILDFDTGEDLIDLTDLGISFDDLSVVANGSGTDLQFAGDTIFELQSVSAGDVTADLFIF